MYDKSNSRGSLNSDNISIHNSDYSDSVNNDDDQTNNFQNLADANYNNNYNSANADSAQFSYNKNIDRTENDYYNNEENYIDDADDAAIDEHDNYLVQDYDDEYYEQHNYINADNDELLFEKQIHNDSDNTLEQKNYIPCDLYTAEVILIYTSFGTDSILYYQCDAIIRLLNCKNVRWYALDINKDSYQPFNLLNNILLDSLASRTNNHIPELIIDGVSVGDYCDIIERENNNELDLIFSRLICPSCLQDRLEGSTICEYCGNDFIELIDDNLRNNIILNDPPLNYVTPEQIIEKLQELPYLRDN